MNVNLCSSLLAGGLLFTSLACANDFPTQARVEYVLGCMNEHGGQNYDNLYKCVCSVDKLAEALPYSEYVEAETFAELRATPGERGGIFRDPPRAGELLAKLSEAKHTAESACSMTRR